MNRFVFTIFFTALFFTFSFAQADQRKQIMKEYITGDSSKKAIFDEMFGTDVQIKNHYLSWRKNGHSSSINIEFLQKYFKFYNFKAKKSLCKNSWVPKNGTDNINSSIPQNFIDSMKSRMMYPANLYPKFKNIDPLKKAELAIFEMCQFSLLSFLSMPFDPAGIGGLKRNFEFDKAFEVVREVCLPITYQVINDEFNREPSLLTLPENMEANKLCRNSMNTKSSVDETSQEGDLESSP